MKEDYKMKMANKDTVCCCLTARHNLLIWGYFKLIISVIMTLWVGFELGITLIIALFYPSMTLLPNAIILLILFTLWLSDIVLISMLIHGVHWKKLHLLQKYYKYSKALWVLIPMSVLLYVIMSTNDLMRPANDWDGNLMIKIWIDLFVMFICLLFQTCAILLGRRELERLEIEETGFMTIDDNYLNDEVAQSLKPKFTMKNETEKPDSSDNEEEVVTTCETVKLY